MIAPDHLILCLYKKEDRFNQIRYLARRVLRVLESCESEGQWRMGMTYAFLALRRMWRIAEEDKYRKHGFKYALKYIHDYSEWIHEVFSLGYVAWDVLHKRDFRLRWRSYQ